MTFYTIELRVSGDNLDVNDIFENFRLIPSEIRPLGWRILNNGIKLPPIWIFTGYKGSDDIKEWQDLEEGIDFIYSFLEGKKESINYLKNKYDIYFYIGCFVDGLNHTINVSEKILRKLNNLEIRFQIEIYVI